MRKPAFVLALALAAPRAGADPFVISPASYGGNLRVDVRCAEKWATPADGLIVTVDGAPVETLGENDVPIVGYSEYGPVVSTIPMDFGYVVTPGRHTIVLAAPGCAAEARDVDVGPMPVRIDGRLAIADRALLGPSGAPDGFGVAIGAYAGRRAPQAGTATFVGDSSTYAFDAAATSGLWFASTVERRGFALGFDTWFGTGSTSGTMQAMSGAPVAATEHLLQMGGAVRVGVRLPLGDAALAGGGGLGGDMWIENHVDTPASASIIATPGPIDGDWFVPLWAAFTYKPWCDWGVQAIAAYDAMPTELGASVTWLSAGLLYQPSAACRERPGLRVR